MTMTNPAPSNPWKSIAIAIGVAAVLLAVGVIMASRGDRSDERADVAERSARAPARVATNAPPRVVEDCNAYAAQMERDKGRILRDAVVGGAAGAGAGAAGGAIV